jgi:hypothetical protein
LGQSGLNVGRHGFPVIRAVGPKQPVIAAPMWPKIAGEMGAEIDPVIELFALQGVLSTGLFYGCKVVC